MRKLNRLLPPTLFLTLYKCFTRPHLDYRDFFYHQPNQSYLTNNIKSVQCNAVLAIVGAIRGASNGTFYYELGFLSWMKKIEDG